MKMLVHRAVTSAQVPFLPSELQRHLRITDDDTAEAQSCGMAAASDLEHFAQIALITQTIRVTIFDPDTGCGITLPVGPVLEGTMATVTLDGEVFTAFELVAGNRPYLRWHADYHVLTPSRLTIEYEAGFGAEPSDIPRDLRQALMDQAALHFDGRSPMDGKSLTTSPHMARVGARYRGVQA